MLLVFLCIFLIFFTIKEYTKEPSWISVFKTFYRPKNINFIHIYPYYFKKKINYKKSNLLNIFRSLYVGKLRFLKRRRLYNLMIKSIPQKVNQNDLAIMTAILRPGHLSNFEEQKLK